MSCVLNEIEKIKNSLNWKVNEKIETRSNDFKIESCPEQKIHQISIPKDTNDSAYNIHKLHEYVHALHYETLPIAFSKNEYILHPSLYPTDLIEIQHIFCCAKDWYVGGYLISACESDYKEYLKNSYDEFFSKQSNAIDEKDYIILGLVSAEASKWLSLTPYNLKKIIKYTNAFLDSDPYKPSVVSLFQLMRKLFNIGNKFNLQLIEENSGIKWKIDF